MPNDVIARTPRAVDSMSVTLRKIELTAEDRVTVDFWREKRRIAAIANARPTVLSSAVPGEREGAPVAFAGCLEAGKHRYCIWIVTPDAYDHRHAFDEAALALSDAFKALGGSAPVVHQPNEWDGPHADRLRRAAPDGAPRRAISRRTASSSTSSRSTPSRPG